MNEQLKSLELQEKTDAVSKGNRERERERSQSA